MNDFRQWPALLGLRQELPAALAYGRGVWGKVHEARSDYRWIAASEGFPCSGGLERDLTIGREAAGRGWFWRPLPGRGACFGGSLYPSRARDKAGRENFLEKQVVSFRMAEDLPAALGALLLLPAAAAWRDDIWWGRSSERLRTDHDYVLPIPDLATVPCSETAIAGAIARGLDSLMAVEDGVLESFYARLLSGIQAFPLCGHGLPPEALAALLLPLERTLSDRLSLVQWTPAGPAGGTDAGGLAGRWDLVVLPQAPRQRIVPAAGESNKASRDRVTALRERDPGPLIRPRPAAPRTAESPPPLAQTGNARLLDPSEPIPPRARLALEAPPPGTWEVLAEIHAFACEVDRRWLEVRKYRDRLAEIPAGSEEAALLGRWAGAVAASRPHYADPRQWAKKAELLRELAACPGSCGR